MRALHDAAAQLPRIAIQKPAAVIGQDTVSAMQSGVFWGYTELIDGLVRRVKKEYGAPMTVIATGGVASLFEGASETIDHYDQTLMEVGLLEVYRRNIKE
jgi:type III pantothenate kinase